MKKDKKTVSIVIFFIFVIFTSIALFNFFRDSYYVFSKNYSESKVLSQEFWPNERILKTNYILSNPQKFDSFWIGASQLNRTNVEGLPGGRWYNSNAAMMSIEEMYRLLQIYKNGGVQIKNVVIQLLDSSFRHPREKYSYFRNIGMIYILYPITFWEKIQFFSYYLFQKPVFNDENIEKWFLDCKYNFLNDGSCAYPPKRSVMVDIDMDNPEKFKEFPEPNYPDYSENWQEDMKNLIDFCKENNIKTFVFIAPETYEYYMTHDMKKIKQIRENLRKITSYWDFTGKNDITLNYSNFFDHVHYTEKTSRKIIKRIFYDNSDSEYNFGTYIQQSQ